jgi:energy-coupling factor transport system substrate-specific component
MGTTTGPTTRRKSNRHWRTVDIVVAAVIAVAGGVIFWGWGQLWNTTSGAFAAFPPAQGFMYGMWLAPGVVGALVIRKPGAALFTELVASVVEALLGSSWGVSVIAYGLAEGVAPELVFAVFWYRGWRMPVAVLAGAAAGGAASLLDLVYYYGAWRGAWQLTYVAIVTASSAAIAGFGGSILVRALARTGVLQPFASGRRAAAS